MNMTDQPIEKSEAELEREQALAARVEAFGKSLVKSRAEAIAARKSSGIEDEWAAAEDAYQGLDDHNRGDNVMAKPTSPYGGVVASKAAKTTRSTVVLNITRPYVDAAAARVGDMLLPTDDSPWAIKPTPIATQTGMASPDEPQGQSAGAAMPAGLPAGQPNELTAPGGMPPGAPGMPGPGAQPAQPPGMPGLPMPAMPGAPVPMAAQSAMQAVDAEMAVAKKAAEGATKQIEDWLVECQWHAEVRKLIEDCARLGTGILKGPTPRRVRRKAMSLKDGIATLVVEESIGPESKAISPWNFYPMGGCGESIHEGSGVWERDSITAKALKDLKGLDYLDSQIDLVIEEGPQAKHNTEGFNAGRVKATDADVYDIWYYYGVAEREDLEAAGVELPEEGDVSAHCIVTMVNGHVIKVAINPLESGDFPYDVMVWQRKAGLPWGTGVAMQINTPQRMLTSAVRNLMDNAGLSAGPQIVVRKGALVPADGKWEITPRKIWFVQDGADVASVEQAFKIFNIPTLQQELNNIIQFAMKMAEDVTGMPAMMQGQGTNAPDTVGGMQMLQNNAGTVLRRIARLFDDRVTEPHIRRYYEWLMLFGEDDSIKGDFTIDARGSTALVERDLQNQSIMQMGALVANPAFGIDPEKWITEMLKAQRLDPKRFLMDPEKKAAMSQQPPPVAPQIEAAKIRAETEMQKAQLVAQKDLQIAQLDSQTALQQTTVQQQTSLQKMQVDLDRDTAYVNSQAQRDAANAMAKREEMALKRDLAMLEYANTNKVTLDKIKADLAKKAMEINATRELAGMEASSDRLPTPPIEPPGLAPAGQSFQR